MNGGQNESLATEAAAEEAEVASKAADAASIQALKMVSDRLDAISSTLTGLENQVRYLPGQIRGLGSKVEGVGTAVTESRYRTLLLGLLGLYDLTDQIVRTQDGASEADLRRRHEVLRTQLRQILEVNGLTPIPASGAFNPEIHCAVERVPVQDPGLANQIAGVVRPGFRAGDGVLRYAEVRVTYYTPPVETVLGPAPGGEEGPQS